MREKSDSKLLVLHFDDDIFELEKVAAALSHAQQNRQFEVVSVRTKKEFDKIITKIRPDVTILDIFSEESGEIGVTLAACVKETHPNCAVIMRSNLDDPRMIRSCLAVGADDFVSKDSDKLELYIRIANAYDLIQIKKGNVPVPVKGKIPIVGKSMKTIEGRIPRIIDSAISSVYINGPSGCGKEVVASIFKSLLPPGDPYVAVNCGAISPTLLESELFGHVKGSFTGASSDRRGLIETAHGGWIFLDEVATLSFSAQTALLRALENGEVTKVGSSTPTKVDVRVLSATNENIEEMIENNLFRLDLWQRLNEVRIYLPPLGKRKHEIPYFVELFCKTMKGGPYSITKSAKDILSEYDWRDGNVRELRNCMRAMTEFQSDKLLTPVSIPDRIYEILDREDADTLGVADLNVGASAMTKESSVKKAGTLEGPLMSQISIGLDLSELPSFEDLCDVLLAEVLIAIASNEEKISLRKLSSAIKIARSTLSARIKLIIQKDQIGSERVSYLISLIGS